MDTFDLNWPGTDARFYTDGWRCRIVWRHKRGGLGGTIDNNDLCKRRVADSLASAPELLRSLIARGHDTLAGEIQALSSDIDETSAVTPVETSSSKRAKAKRAPAKPSSSAKAGSRAPAKPSSRAPAKSSSPEVKPSASARIASPASAAPSVAAAQPSPQASDADKVQAWLDQLEGSADWEKSGVRRSFSWQACGELDEERLHLKAPAKVGKADWVLKSSWDKPKRKTQYIAATDLRGICCYLSERGMFGTAGMVERWLEVCAPLKHGQLEQAQGWWRDSKTATTGN